MIRRMARIAEVMAVLALAPIAQAKEGAPPVEPSLRGREGFPLPGMAKEGAFALECYSIALTRRKIVEHRLIEPFPLMQAESSVNQAEALSTRLCRKGELLLYEIDLLRRDGRVLKVFVDAVSGKPLVSHSDH